MPYDYTEVKKTVEVRTEVPPIPPISLSKLLLYVAVVGGSTAAGTVIALATKPKVVKK
jgi:hypothetical protein